MSSNQTMEDMYYKREFTDITFRIDGEDIRAHKVILAMSCDYFKTMLFGGTNEANSAVITLSGTPAKAFQQVIRFCYLKDINTGKWMHHEVMELLSLAHEYDCQPLINKVAQVVPSYMNEKTVADLYSLVTKLEILHLENSILQFIRKNATSMLKSEAFMTYPGEFVTFFVENMPYNENVKKSFIPTIWKWKALVSEDEVQAVFQKIDWCKFPTKALSDVIKTMVPQTQLASLPNLPPPTSNEESSPKNPNGVGPRKPEKRSHKDFLYGQYDEVRRGGKERRLVPLHESSDETSSSSVLNFESEDSPLSSESDSD